jgi:hypothetical protein
VRKKKTQTAQDNGQGGEKNDANARQKGSIATEDLTITITTNHDTRVPRHCQSSVVHVGLVLTKSIILDCCRSYLFFLRVTNNKKESKRNKSTKE